MCQHGRGRGQYSLSRVKRLWHGVDRLNELGATTSALEKSLPMIEIQAKRVVLTSWDGMDPGLRFQVS